MKQLTAVLLCLLLLGCGRQTSSPPPETQPPAVSAGLYDPDHPMEKAYPGQVRAYPLPSGEVQGIRALGKDVLVFSGQERTTLTVFVGEELREAASLTLDFALQPEDPSVQIRENFLSCFDPVRQETVVLDHRLREKRRIAAPEGLEGRPLLSGDGKRLYYCTGWAVMAWDLDTGIRRTVKELSYENQELTGLHLGDTILACSIRQEGISGRRFLSADLGTDITSVPDNASLTTGEVGYFAVLPQGFQTLLVFGKNTEDSRLLFPRDSWQQQYYLPEDHAAVTAAASRDSVTLDYYELNTGILRASLTLDAPQAPRAIVNTKDHAVYILAQDSAADRHTLYRWDVLRQAPDPANTKDYTAAYPTAENADTEALEACRKQAQAIGEAYGINVRILQDATAVQPWDYRFEPEVLAPLLEQELQILEEGLSRYPRTLLEQTKAHFSGLTICLVRQITGTREGGSLTAATGIQFFEDNEAYVVIAGGKYSRQALYHELYHVMETHILTESTALDTWEALNPAGFVYGGQQEDIYLQGQTRAFVDRYSMGAPKEDRARILENAMLPEKEDLFRSEYMQRKLKAICLGIREAYGLEDCTEVLPWEQYLVTPLIPEA